MSSPKHRGGGSAPQAIPQAAAQAQAWLQQGFALQQQGQLTQAEQCYRLVLHAFPQQFDALHLLGVIATQTGRPQEAVDWIRRALVVQPQTPGALNNLGNALADLKRHAEAVEAFDQAIALQPDFAQAHNNRGTSLRALKRSEDALAAYDRAIALKPDYAQAHTNRGNACMELKRLDDALAAHDHALALQPGHVDAWCNRADVLRQMARYTAALQACDRALALKPTHAEAYGQMGNVFMAQNEHGPALEAFEQSLKLKPDHLAAHIGIASVLVKFKRHGEALSHLDQALRLDPQDVVLHGRRLGVQQAICDWTDWATHVQRIEALVAQGQVATDPFSFLSQSQNPALHKRLVELSNTHTPPAAPLPAPPPGPKIRLGYFSGDFHNHATMFLMAEVFELHDKSRFELFAYSFGPDKQDAMRQRAMRAFDHFHDVRGLDDAAVVQLARGHQLDIAIDLKGYTQDARASLFAHRVAPVQANYLGYPGTIGMPQMDYIIADPVLIPPEMQAHYTEKVAYLPDSYQCNDRHRAIAPQCPSRADLGLPETGFVFCCFNNNYKITPEVFGIWMRLLRQVPGSVLWLLEDNSMAADNLRRHAQAHGVEPTRLVFAPRMELPDHLARHAQADLFVDTWPYNAHTTTSDALWAGLPVLTCAGPSFASRVAASLLNAVGLPEMVTHTPADYEAAALRWAGQPDALQGLRQRLWQGRAAAPLFNTQRFVHALEALYQQMQHRSRQGLPPTHLHA